ncbi:TMEM254 [Cervus elaphus hippelaphus]|uniref:Transmembrane protein 254 n=2 Tax=Cervus TaxID=9859 RepID=A0A212CQ38_CEREH|nr:TMEM254 [Cervus elaphus hippelaphus]
MGNAREDETYFQRTSLFWVTVIILSFGYYTVTRSFKMVAKSEAGGAAASYFRVARPLPSLVTVLVLGYFGWMVFWPESIPYQSLGPLGSFTQYLLKHHHTLVHGGYWLSWMIHVGESLFAIVLCKSKGITDAGTQLLWFLQTFLFGMASLYYLIAFRPKRQKQT